MSSEYTTRRCSTEGESDRDGELYDRMNPKFFVKKENTRVFMSSTHIHTYHIEKASMPYVRYLLQSHIHFDRTSDT